ncbi:glycosyltransferase family 2 protein [Polyangium sp. 6x1]|uniref:glycosyltransferase family 2 protein n=1 Tax=Polyangium sp. 6x1 TaxID=3042689 RepID=UPI00248275B7|nr:glycosyltransferase family 2 protein [Polyangium sp. 6x1]MDI1444920.1 glycosyltransferase family 2 protein [Polyangium sp. 6x1]
MSAVDITQPSPGEPPAIALARKAAESPVVILPRVSLVVPGLNEAASLPELARRIDEALSGKEQYELIFVDDGSTDDSWSVIKRLASENPAVRGVRLRKNFGKAQALTAGFRKARGTIFVTMDADLQDDPADLPNFLTKLEEGNDVVVGWKVQRLDPTNRLFLSRIFNGTVGLLTGVKLHDMNCGFKAYRCEVIRSIPIYGDLFRFIPALAASQGFSVTEIPIKHHARKYGSSRYGLERILRGSFDLLSVLFLTRYQKRPMHLFGFAGLTLAGIGMLIELYLTVLWCFGHKIGDRPLLILGVLMIVTGIQLFSMGFIGEFLTYQSQTRHLEDEPPIREETL